MATNEAFIVIHEIRDSIASATLGCVPGVRVPHRMAYDATNVKLINATDNMTTHNNIPGDLSDTSGRRFNRHHW